MRDVIINQANCVFDVLEGMIRNIPAEAINTGDRPTDVLGRQALHILGAFDRYSSKGFRWYKRYGKSYGLFGVKCDPNEIPGKKEIARYLKAVRRQFEKHVSGLSTEHLSKEVSTRRGRFKTNMGRYIYLLRHNTLHLGYMKALMVREGYAVEEFK